MSEERFWPKGKDQEIAAGSIGMLFLSSTPLLGEEQADRFLDADNEWAHTKGKFPEYTDQIEGLRKVLLRIRKSREVYDKLSYTAHTERQVRAGFMFVQDEAAQELLSAILWSRSIRMPESGYIQTDLMKEQLAKMREEMGNVGLDFTPDLEFPHVMSAILNGHLKLQRPD